jgi:hypothetical protein
VADQAVGELGALGQALAVQRHAAEHLAAPLGDDVGAW